MAKRKVATKKIFKNKRNVVRRVALGKPKPKVKSKPKEKLTPRPKQKQRLKPKSLKLTIDLVPQTQWNKNLRGQVRGSVWDKLRKETYAQAGFKCQICNAEGRLNCHEMWEYDEKNLVQHLVGFHAVCSMCHHVTHYGMSTILANRGHLDIDDVVKHFMRVNDVSREAFIEHLSEATEIWRRRSRFNKAATARKPALALSSERGLYSTKCALASV
jgi:hypothetical protein